jgi:hypothetical protein
MIHLGCPSDLVSTKRYICVVAHTYATDSGSSMISFEHVFTQASCEDAAYDSIEMLDLENRLISLGATLVNNYVAEVSL